MQAGGLARQQAPAGICRLNPRVDTWLGGYLKARCGGAGYLLAVMIS